MTTKHKKQIVETPSTQTIRRHAVKRRSIEPRYQLLITCRDEADQERLYEEMTQSGRSCRVLTF